MERSTRRQSRSNVIRCDLLCDLMYDLRCNSMCILMYGLLYDLTSSFGSRSSSALNYGDCCNVWWACLLRLPDGLVSLVSLVSLIKVLSLMSLMKVLSMMSLRSLMRLFNSTLLIRLFDESDALEPADWRSPVKQFHWKWNVGIPLGLLRNCRSPVNFTLRRSPLMIGTIPEKQFHEIAHANRSPLLRSDLGCELFTATDCHSRLVRRSRRGF